MSRVKSFKNMFVRYRRPGDLVFAWLAFLVALFLLLQINDQTDVTKGGKLVARPWFWPFVSLLGMTAFAALHLLGSAVSKRIDGRVQEIGFWARSIEYAAWFVIYAIVVPIVGYLPCTIIFAVALAYRAGYRSGFSLGSAAVAAIVVVLLFKSFLQVKIPGGQFYEHLPDGLRSFFLTYL